MKELGRKIQQDTYDKTTDRVECSTTWSRLDPYGPLEEPIDRLWRLLTQAVESYETTR